MWNVVPRNDASSEVGLFYTMLGKSVCIAVDWSETSHMSVSAQMCSAIRTFCARRILIIGVVVGGECTDN
jgi:hypothetical protein